MNQFVPDWNGMGDSSRPLGEDDDLMELLWCNGHVVMQSQTNRKLPPRPDKAPAPVPAVPATTVASQEDEAGLWFPFALADSLEKDIFSEFFCEAPVAAPPVDAGKPSSRDVPMPPEDVARSAVSEAPCELMPPPKSAPVSSTRQQTMSLAQGGGSGENAGELSDLVRAGSAGKAAVTEAGGGASSSMLSAIGSSICGSNQVLVRRASDDAGGRALPSAMGSANGNANASASGGGGGGRGGHEAAATTVASSSGRSNGCFGAAATTTTEPTSSSHRSSKRKRLDTEDSESPSEDAESESAAAMLARKPPQKLTTARRSRAAEVHNLSERRRRDRINEKMRALQDLIPHCNKTDKASMLDEAIEYLKTLQLQVQMMWMGGGIAAPPAVMFPGVHQYLPRMPPMARVPFMPPQAVVPSGAVPLPPAAAGYRGHIAEPYAHYHLGVNHHLQPPPPPSQHYAQGVGYYPMEAKAVQVQQQSPAIQVPGGGVPAAAEPGVLPPETAPSRGPAG